MRVALLFPGQGSQFIGMGKEIYDSYEEARNVFLEVDNILNQDLSKLMFEGDINELTFTSNLQPAIMTVSMAVINVILKQYGVDDISAFSCSCAGHSLGEYSALCASKSITLNDTAQLLRIRGNAMANAMNEPGAMLALLGVSIEAANAITKEVLASTNEICEVANDNCEGQIVISGTVNAIDYALQIAKQHNCKKAVKLPVSSAFHSSFMIPVEDILKQTLGNIEIKNTVVPVISNYDAQPIRDIKHSLIKQVSNKVKWRESILNLYRKFNVRTFIEIGPGKVLSSMVKRSFSDIRVFNAHLPSEIEEVIESLIKAV